ncbi:disease resistance protein RPP13-like [Arachis duranensis]|uniref:Disease resistance protein RPP13-like n=1 Tax=Arachis duranensis TaxID=130453 RepID=A0A9C6WP48_ARADU|nr:disease resistance protein RPP13-like [Arachis duranensis]
MYGDGNKTTFVGELFNRFRHQFEAASFLHKVSEKSRRSADGLENLQETLLHEMGVHKKPKLGSTLKGSSIIKQSLHNKRVFLVLDDVDSIEQLDSLAGEGDWFCPGSRIVITTRDAKFLNNQVLDGFKIEKYCINEGEFEGMQGARSNQKQDKVFEEDMVGFVDIFNNVTKQLKENETNLNVISVIGMGGLGKTILIKKIYNNNEVKKLFSYCVWITVSKDYKATELLQILLKGCGLSESTKGKDISEDDQKSKVQKFLEKKKYLIVLDDIWEPEVWAEVECLFPDNNKGSAILITSRNDGVANYTGSKSYFPPLLDEDESWKLFCKKVFKGGECPSVLESIGRLMTEKCRGLPLAIITLAGVVGKKKRLTVEWMRIMRSVIWYLAKDNSKVTKVLKLGLIQAPKTGILDAPELEDIAEEYLNELVMVAKRRSDGGVKSCRIHDLLLDLCISEIRAEKECSTKDQPDPICTLPNLETLIVEEHFHRYKLPHGIWRLKKLRHLEGRLYITSKTVPPDTSGEDCLPNLQTL